MVKRTISVTNMLEENVMNNKCYKYVGRKCHEENYFAVKESIIKLLRGDLK